MLASSMSIGMLALQLVAAYVIYFAAKCLYRLTLHPLARFPGPKKAAASKLFAMSWDIPFGTSYVKEFTTWHERYNSPIVRIEPNHLHFQDVEAYNEIFKMGTKFARDPAIYSFPATAGSMFNRLGPKEGLAHRSLYNSYFSKLSVQNLEYVIRKHLSQFLTRIEEATAESKPVDLTLGFRCLMADSLCAWMYARPFGALMSPGFKNPMIIAVQKMLESGPAGAWYGGKPFIMLFNALLAIPRDWVPDEGIKESFRILDGCKKRVLELSNESPETMAPNVFQTALNPKIEKGQPKLSFDDLAADGLVMFSAGTDTTANALSFGIYHLIKTPSVLQKLKSEIYTAIPNPTALSPDPEETKFPLDWSQLDKLPYLHAVVKEAIRKSYGVPGKLPRVVPPGGATLSGHFIPAGTTVSSSSSAYFDNPACYATPEEFRPERWIPDADGGWSANGGVDPDKFFIAFGRGSRSCLGINLAYAQLNYTIAYLVRNFDMALDENMKPRDMEWHDCFTTATFGHLNVKFKRVQN